MIRITGFKWVPPFAAGNVRDHRVRWILNEAGWPYEVQLIDAQDQRSAGYRAEQPFGQVPVMEEEGRPTLFESGAIVLDVALRSGVLLPEDEGQRSLVLSWYFAALNSVEQYLANLAEVDYFMKDEAQKAARRPEVLAAAEKRLGELQAALGDRHWLVGDSFTIADLMMASVLKIARGMNLLEHEFPKLLAWQDRCFDRRAYIDAIGDQCAEIAAHEPADMKYPAGAAS